MKIKDLLAQLQPLNPEMEVLVYSEDAVLLGEYAPYRLLDIVEIDSGRAVADRGPQGEPMLRFERTPDAREFAFLHVVADF
jgi:hypothetical protein